MFANQSAAASDKVANYFINHQNIHNSQDLKLFTKVVFLFVTAQVTFVLFLIRTNN